MPEAPQSLLDRLWCKYLPKQTHIMDPFRSIVFLFLIIPLCIVQPFLNVCGAEKFAIVMAESFNKQRDSIA